MAIQLLGLDFILQLQPDDLNLVILLFDDLVFGFLDLDLPFRVILLDFEFLRVADLVDVGGLKGDLGLKGGEVLVQLAGLVTGEFELAGEDSDLRFELFLDLD